MSDQQGDPNAGNYEPLPFANPNATSKFQGADMSQVMMPPGTTGEVPFGAGDYAAQGQQVPGLGDQLQTVFNQMAQQQNPFGVPGVQAPQQQGFQPASMNGQPPQQVPRVTPQVRQQIVMHLLDMSENVARGCGISQAEAIHVMRETLDMAGNPQVLAAARQMLGM